MLFAAGPEAEAVSIQAMTWVLEHSEARLAARLVLLAVANHADADGENAWPSVAAMAREAHVSEREVQRSLEELEELGELEIMRGTGPRGAHLYRLAKMPKRAVEKPVEKAG